MKNVKTILIVITMVGFGLVQSSCSEDNNLTGNQIQSQIESSVASKTWKITFFEDSGKDETDHFSGYSFTFKDDGKITADNGVNHIEGTWKIADNNSSDDSQDDLDFIIHFNLTNDFEDLNEDWDIISSSDIKIELVHVSGGNGGTDFLTFESL